MFRETKQLGNSFLETFIPEENMNKFRNEYKKRVLEIQKKYENKPIKFQKRKITEMVYELIKEFGKPRTQNKLLY